MKRVFCLVIISVFLMTTFAGCYDRREIDDQAFVIALGIDKGKTNSLKLTLQLAVPNAIGGGGEGGGEAEKATTIITLDAPTIYSGLNMANITVSRQLNLSHAKAIVFSKELAMQGIGPMIIGLSRGREFRPTINVIVARGEAEEYIKSVKPVLESNPAKYYELNSAAYTYTSFTANTTYHKFYTASKALYMQPVATLGGVNKYDNTKQFDPNKSTVKEKGRDFPLEGDFKAGDLPKVSDLKSEIMGLAVFNGGKMVGELDGEETSYHLMVSGEFNHAYITQPDPQEKGKIVILDVKRSRQPQHWVNITGEKPQIKVKIQLEADIVAIQSGINYERPEMVSMLETAYEAHIREGLLRYLNKTAKVYRADICGFGQDVKKKFLTWNQWENFNWLAKYPNAEFNVDVDVKIRRPGLTVRSAPIVLSPGEGGTQ